MPKSILITGASDGMGLYLANRFYTNGWKVLGTCRNPEKYKAKIPFRLLKCDQQKMSEIKSFSREIQEDHFDACVLNAGVAAFSLLPHISEEEYDHVMNTNFKGTLFMLQKVVPQIKEAGSVIIIGSVSPRLGMKGSAVYAASKAALVAIMKVLANELCDRMIRVNIISPGMIDTNMYAKFQPSVEKTEKLKQLMTSKTKLKRLGTVEEIGDLTEFLISDQSSYITGQEYIIDGGLTNGIF